MLVEPLDSSGDGERVEELDVHDDSALESRGPHLTPHTWRHEQERPLVATEDSRARYPGEGADRRRAVTLGA